MSDDVVTRLRKPGWIAVGGSRAIDLGDEAADEIERLRALSDQLAEALREVSEITKVLHGRGDMADCLIQSFTTLATYEAGRKEADRG